MLGKSLLLTASILFLATSCSSGNEKASSEPTVSPPTEIVTSSPTPDPTPTPAVSPTAEPSSTPTASPKTIESKKVVTPSATPTPKKSKATSKPSPSTKKLTNAELALKYPPTIGVKVPWYNPTPEQAGKAYTDLKAYEVGENYALYQEESSILFVWPSVGKTDYTGDTVVWSAIRITRVMANEIKINENVKSGYGVSLIAVEWCDAEMCGYLYRNLLEKIKTFDPMSQGSMFQTWSQIRK
jgi:hypothetical protein